jgi:hypothetical protein
MTHASRAEQPERPLSARIRRLKKAAAAAREEANLMLENAAARLPSQRILPRVLATAGAKPMRMAANVVRRHPISSILIAGVLVGTAVYHGRSREK